MKEYTFEEITIGQEESFCVEITKEKMDAFRVITGDENPLHHDAVYAASQGFGGGVVSYGLLTASFLSTLAGMYLPGRYSLIHSVEVKFPKAVCVMDKTTLVVRGKVAEKQDIFNVLMIKVAIENEDGEKVCRGTMKVGVRDEK
ncbi:MAG: dehydratase [Defluviitaleaceae bacterium]|nr:dehydratase [Defluviitaleaceae bacterium]MCL2238358.1 dehydratase [Defluviitaleaceae bacterium]